MTILDRFRLDGQVAVVTGASSGLGAACAIALAEAGADVVLAARRQERLRAVAAAVTESGRNALVIPTDVSDPAQCAALAAAAADFGPVSVAVNCAGIAAAVPASRETPEQFRTVIEVDLMACYWVAKAVAPAMTGGGSIVNVSSIAALVSVGLPQAAYSAAKAGLLGLTRDLAAQWTGRRGIRVNAVVPGFVSSEMTDGYAPGYLEPRLAGLPIARIGTAEEIAAAVLFLASPASAYVTGSALVVDGGLTIT